MKKIKLFLAAALACFSAGAWAQTDVTSTYLTNADFEADEALTSTYLYGYGKDGSPYGFQTVTGWTSVVTNGDNSTSGKPNSGMAGGVFSYGSSTQLKGNAKAAPATNPDGEASGKCFGFFGVWGCGGYYYQNVTLAAGKYTITVPMYSQSGTQANTTYTGFFPKSGTNRTIAVNPTVGQWVNQTVTFTLADDTEGQIRIGYQSTGNGSGANPMLFIDCVKIEFTAIVVKDVLETALTAATKANTALGGSLDAAIATAQAVYNNADATQEEVNNAAATLNAAVDTAMATADNINVTDLFLTNTTLSSTEGWTLSASSQYHDQGSYQIDGSSNVRFAAPTADGTHLSSEYAFGFECRWSTNYTSYYQTTDPVPAGVYTLTFDVENVNNNTTSASYLDLNYIQVGEKKYYSSTTEWMSAKSSWTTHTIRVTVEEAAQITISFGYGTGDNNIGADNTPALYVSHVKLSYSGFLAGAKAAWDEAKAAAEAAVSNSDYDNVTGSERTALNTEIGKAEPTTVDGYNEAADALNAAMAAFTAAKDSYDAYAEANGIATMLEATAVTAPTSAAEAVTRAQELYVNIDTQVKSDFAHDVTTVYAGSFSGSFSSTTTGQHWSDDTSKSYLDNWGSGNISAKQDIALPAGSYVLKVAGRGSVDAVSHKLYASANGTTVNIPNNGDTGKGIDTSGAVNYGEGTFANNNIGRGWEWRFIPVTLSEETTVTVTLTMERSGDNTWGSFSDFTILCDDATYAPIALAAAKAELQAVIDAAPAVLTANIGDGVFQMPEAGVTTYSEAKTAAQNAHDAVDATLESIADAKTTFEAAIEPYNVLEINAPADGKLFNVVLTYGGWTYDQKAATYMAGDRSDMGGYNIKYNAPANQNLAQAFTFTKVSGNNYKMSQIDADGNVRYISTGTPWDGNAYQIRTTTNADDALVVTVIPTNTEGVWNLWNTEAKEYIGSQDAGFFTVNSHIDFNIVETSKPSITINTTEAGWGTTILPFAQTLPEGVTAYSVNELKADQAELELVKEDALEANKPYIIEGSWEAILTGDAQGTALNYTDGLLTGVYTQIAAPENTYILQKQGEKVGFFLVDYTDWQYETKPQVKANRAYLTVPAETPVKAFYFEDATDAIQSVFDGVAAGDIYDLAGRKVSRMQKGNVYIVNGKKVLVK